MPSKTILGKSAKNPVLALLRGDLERGRGRRPYFSWFLSLKPILELETWKLACNPRTKLSPTKHSRFLKYRFFPDLFQLKVNFDRFLTPNPFKKFFLWKFHGTKFVELVELDKKVIRTPRLSPRERGQEKGISSRHASFLSLSLRAFGRDRRRLEMKNGK